MRTEAACPAVLPSRNHGQIQHAYMQLVELPMGLCITHSGLDVMCLQTMYGIAKTQQTSSLTASLASWYADLRGPLTGMSVKQHQVFCLTQQDSHGIRLRDYISPSYGCSTVLRSRIPDVPQLTNMSPKPCSQSICFTDKACFEKYQGQRCISDHKVFAIATSQSCFTSCNRQRQ